MKTLIILVISILLLTFLGIKYLAFSDDDYWEEYNKQNIIGTSYMRSLSEKEVQFIVDQSLGIMNNLSSQNMISKSFGPFNKEPVPPEWKNIGVTGIKSTQTSVHYYWCGGGPVERTLLEVSRDDNQIKLIGSFRGNTELLKTIKKANKAQ